VDATTPLYFALVFAAALMLLEGGYRALPGNKHERAQRKRARLQEIGRSLAAEVESDAGETMFRIPQRRQGFVMRLQLLLLRAGSMMSPARFLLASVAGAALGFTILFSLWGDWFRALPGFAIGFAPYLAISRAAAQRTQRFAEQLPAGLELLTRSLRAGHALGAGFQLVGTGCDDPLGTEFTLVSEELRFGLDLRDALANLTTRVDNADLPFFTTAVLIQRQTGGNLAELLETLGGLLRERIQFTGRVRALTAQGRGAATFLALWLPFIVGLLMVISPEFIRPMFETTIGRVTLAAATGVDVIAYFLARRIADVQA
jgi:tight adherence protein B